MNEDLLSEVPHLKFGDLSVIFQVKVNEKPFGNGVITLKNEHIKLWNDDISPYELFELARKNIEKQDPITIRSMYEVLSSLVPAPEDTDIKACPMYVATNESKISGAVAILFADKLMEFADKIDSDLLILPSSVQELVIVPSEMNADLSNLLAMVKEINETQVSPEEVLSDSVYIFDRETQMVCDAVTGNPCVLTEDMEEAAA